MKFGKVDLAQQGIVHVRQLVSRWNVETAELAEQLKGADGEAGAGPGQPSSDRRAAGDEYGEPWASIGRIERRLIALGVNGKEWDGWSVRVLAMHDDERQRLERTLALESTNANNAMSIVTSAVADSERRRQRRERI